ncbi:hypothetical protein RvY_15736 [Ramazzottius varieornatus]|uniref:Uncharacterized protein n=1 Tax=Ramazzottius varieornatus TaxID=947166 RepID=A0A1D1VXG8_RAMVA|nr:hypothetical protein RvY_15736 [Ramazzottius varieornatus]
MEREKNIERREHSDDSGVNSSFKTMSLQSDNSNRRRSTGDDDGENEFDDDIDLPDSLLQSFSTGIDEKEYDMLSNSSLNDQGGDQAGIPGMQVTGLDGEILNGVYFDKLELELNAIESAMSQFEGRLDTLRDQAQDLLKSLQNERLSAAVTDDIKTPSETYASRNTNLELQKPGGGDN